jgi:hypothetical protein
VALTMTQWSAATKGRQMVTALRWNAPTEVEWTADGSESRDGFAVSHLNRSGVLWRKGRQDTASLVVLVAGLAGAVPRPGYVC